MEELRDENSIGNNYQQFLDLRFKILDNKNSLNDEKKRFHEKIEIIETFKKRLSSNQKRLGQISNELAALKNVDKLEVDRNKFMGHKINLESRIEILGKEIEDNKTEQKSIEREIEKLGQISIGSQKSEMDVFIDEISIALEESKQNLIEATRKDIENFASKKYKELYKNVSEVERIELDKDYKIRVVLKKNNHEYVKSNFSTGEGLVFAISFLSALRSHSGYSGPIFLDSPFSVLDKEHRVRVSLNLPKSIPGQLIIFTRPDTFEDIKKEIIPFANKLLTLSKEKEWHNKISVRG